MGHVKRSVFDCFKFLNAYYNNLVEKFEKKTKYIDLTVIDNGTFYIKYRNLRQSAINKVREAKREETINQETSFAYFQEAYNLYVELEELIDNNFTKITWARGKFHSINILKMLGWVALAIISGILSSDDSRTVIFSLFK